MIDGDMLSIPTNSSPGGGSSGNQTQATHLQAIHANHHTTVAYKSMLICIKYKFVAINDVVRSAVYRCQMMMLMTMPDGYCC